VLLSSESITPTLKLALPRDSWQDQDESFIPQLNTLELPEAGEIMDKISAESVEQAYAAVCGLTGHEAYRLSYDFQKDQPLLVAYLTAVDTEILNQEERELLFYLGTIIWKVMSTINKNLLVADEEYLLSLEAANQEITDSLRTNDSVKFAEVVKKLLIECRQPEVLRYAIAVLMDEDNAENTVRDENLGIIMVNLKTVIEYLDR
jgi:hypothetical protein